jgi:hypothetical protein
MSRTILLFALSAALLPGLALAEETTVYKSKNADGTTVYSQIETDNAQAQKVAGQDPAAPPAAAEEAPKSQSEQACENARTRLNLLNSGERLRFDKDGDGVNEDMSPEDIASEKDLAQRQQLAFCPPAEPET